MALSATVHTFAVHLSDVDREVYRELELRVARHPSETAEFMVTRVLATHRDPAKVLGQWAGKRIHRAEAIALYGFDRAFVDSAVAAVRRRNVVTLSRHERLLDLELNGTSLSTEVGEHRL
ncbi:YaeQ family protein [Nocardia wallacei]|uniref:YaeQ family protein n=1 Tax=Nocardia wallacei TaxID=480035 RepID=UPI002456DFB8|nr:YaeQ family protein [Nocardia wallacei]